MKHEQLFEQAKAMMQQAYVPYSNFQVGCAIRAGDGKLYAGCNIENAAYGLTLCAEAAAIAAMVTAGQQQIKELVVVANSDKLVTPCGACRQRIVEFAEGDTPIHLSNKDKICKTMTLEQLLPQSFGPKNLD